jgi:hypothetical protein
MMVFSSVTERAAMRCPSGDSFGFVNSGIAAKSAAEIWQPALRHFVPPAARQRRRAP